MFQRQVGLLINNVSEENVADVYIGFYEAIIVCAIIDF